MLSWMSHELDGVHRLDVSNVVSVLNRYICNQERRI